MTDPLVAALRGKIDNIREPFASFEEAWATWAKTIGMMRDHYKGPPKASGFSTERICVIPDIHAPFHEERMLAAILAKEEGLSDRCLLLGDVGDSYALSTFAHYQNVPFSEEWASVTQVMQAVSEAFPRVDVVIGNHDMRLEKRLRERLSEEMVDAVKYLTGGILCPLTALCKRYPNVQVAKHPLPNGDSIDWFTTIGDAWFGHPEKYSRVPGSALRSVEDWLSDHEDDFGLGRFRLIVMGHTHVFSMLPWRGRQLLVEAGALCQLQGYMTKPRLGGRPQIRGYLTFEQTDGVTDLSSVRFHWLDQDPVYAQSSGSRPAARRTAKPKNKRRRVA